MWRQPQLPIVSLTSMTTDDHGSGPHPDLGFDHSCSWWLDFVLTPDLCCHFPFCETSTMIIIVNSSAVNFNNSIKCNSFDAFEHADSEVIWLTSLISTEL